MECDWHLCLSMYLARSYPCLIINYASILNLQWDVNNIINGIMTRFYPWSYCAQLTFQNCNSIQHWLAITHGILQMFEIAIYIQRI